MLTFLGIKVSYETLAFLALFLGSEIVAASKLKENSIVQLLLNAVNSLKPFRTDEYKKKEDDSKASLNPKVLLLNTIHTWGCLHLWLRKQSVGNLKTIDVLLNHDGSNCPSILSSN
jgi:hypothetical protein